MTRELSETRTTAHTQYPQVDTSEGGYTAEIAGDSFEIPPMRLPGVHDTFQSAWRRAMRVAAALTAAGEVGARPHVGFSGIRPTGFPRNGVSVG